MITVYTKDNCPDCKKTKQFLTRQGVEFKEVNVLEDEKALDFVKFTLGYTSLPVVTKGEIEFNGFQPDKLEELV